MTMTDHLHYVPSTIHRYGGTLTLDAAEEHVAWTITIPKTGTLKKIGWTLSSVSSPVLTVKVSLETVADAVGVPVATSDAGKTLYAAGAQSAAIDNPSAGNRFDAINGSSPDDGIAVTVGDLASVVIRCTARTSGSVSIGAQMYGASLLDFYAMGLAHPYTYHYTGSSAVYTGFPVVTLEYSDGFAKSPLLVPCGSIDGGDSWNSTSNPDRRGVKFKFLNAKRIVGAWIYNDLDYESQAILYGSNEYTVQTGFPITLDPDKRKFTLASMFYVGFPTAFTAVADTWYRFVILPTTANSSYLLYYRTPADDGAYLGMELMCEGTRFIYTSFNGTPSSGSHAWTDDATKIPYIIFVCDQEDVIPDYPDVGNVTEDDTVNGVAGTYHEATVAEVQAGVMFGAGSALEGTYVGGGGGPQVGAFENGAWR